MRSTAVFPPNRNPNSTLTLIVTYPVSQCVAFNPGSAMPLFRIPYSKILAALFYLDQYTTNMQILGALLVLSSFPYI